MSSTKLLGEELKVLNIGLEIFYRALKDQGIRVVHVEWSPSAKLEEELEEILDKLT